MSSEEMSTEPRVIGRELLTAYFGQMAWPIPNHQVGWQVRYTATPPIISMMHAAAELDAYAKLIAMPQRRRNYVISQIRKAMSKKEATND